MKKFFSNLLKSKRLWVATLAVAIVGGVSALVNNQSSAAGCSTNDIMPCGASGPSNFITKLERNNPSDMDNIYANWRYDLPKSQYEEFEKYAKAGKINPDNGNVTVGGKTIGYDGLSLGRNPKSSSVKITIDDKAYYQSHIKDLTRYFNDAMVLFDSKGNVQTVIMNICGNPIRVTPNDPKYACKALTVTPTDNPNMFKFSSSVSASNGASVTKVVYDFGDGTTKTETSPSTVVSHTYATAGTYNAKVTAYVKTTFGRGEFPITVTADCKKTITIKEVPAPKIEVQKKVDGVEHKTVGVNTEFTYQVNVKNTGNVDLVDVVVTDEAPAGVTFLSASAGTIVNGEWKVTIALLKKDESRDFTITAKVPTLIAGTIKNTVCVDTPTIPGSPDDCDDATIDVPGVIITKLVNGKEEAEVNVGEEFIYSLVVKNTGGTLLKNVVVTDKAPDNVQFIRTDKGTVDGNQLNYTIPELASGQSIQINIIAKVTKHVAVSIKNTACVDAPAVPGNPDDCDDAFVKVPQPVYTCDALTVTRISRTEFSFKTDYTVKNATFVKTVYIIRDAKGNEIARTEATTYTQTTAGSYTVEALVVVNVDGVEKIATSPNCKKPFEVTELPVVEYTCDELNVRLISRTQFEFKATHTVENATYVKTVFIIRKDDGTQIAKEENVSGVLLYTQETVGKYTAEAQIVVTVDGVEKVATSPNCKKPFEVTELPVVKVEVCDPTTGKIITVDKADENKYEPKDSEKCKPLEVCVISEKTIRTVSREEYLKNPSLYADTDSEYCEEVPDEIPSTGPIELVSSIAGIGALGYGAYTYAASRRALKNALK